MRLISDVFNFGRATLKPNFGLCWFQSAAAPARHVFDVASKVPLGDEPRATHVTHARLQPQTETASPKLEPAFARPKLKSSEIRRTSLKGVHRTSHATATITFPPECGGLTSGWGVQPRYGQIAG